MEKKITITLNKKAEAHFSSLAAETFSETTTDSDLINHCLGELYDFEHEMKQSVSSFIDGLSA